MNKIQTENFDSVFIPKSFTDIIESISESDNPFLTRMWRGQADIKWPIHSTAYRRIKPNSELDFVSYEKSLLEHATHKGFRYHSGRELSDFELLAILQHHGAATRLIDASRNVLVALWFTCCSEPEKTGSLIGIHTDYLGGYESENESRPYQEVIDEASECNHCFTWEPPIITNRIAAQHSQFVYSNYCENKWGSLMLQKPEEMIVYSVSPGLKLECLKILEQVFDIRTLTMFPDIDGFGLANSHSKDRNYNYRW